MHKIAVEDRCLNEIHEIREQIRQWENEIAVLSRVARETRRGGAAPDWAPQHFAKVKAAVLREIEAERKSQDKIRDVVRKKQRLAEAGLSVEDFRVLAEPAKAAAPAATPDGADESAVKSLIDFISVKLRLSMRRAPSAELEIQDALETILNARDTSFERDKIAITYSTKTFRPDFTIDSLHLAIEVKLCKTKDKEKKIVEEINADIPAYKTKYGRLLFVVYDLGIIRDEQKFKTDIEANPGVSVLVVKH